MSLRSIARRGKRGEREFLVIPQERLRAWAAAQGLSRRRAIELALEAGIFPECFERNFPSLTPAEQLALWQSSALVLGLGGLGGLQAQLLARAGVGQLYLADGDVFAASNLNRQLLATNQTLGQNKAAVTARHLLKVNEAIIVEAIPAFLDAKRLLDFLPSVQVLLDALDTLATRRELINTAKQAGVPVVHGAVSGTFRPGNNHPAPGPRGFSLPLPAPGVLDHRDRARGAGPHRQPHCQPPGPGSHPAPPGKGSRLPRRPGPLRRRHRPVGDLAAGMSGSGGGPEFSVSQPCPPPKPPTQPV